MLLTSVIIYLALSLVIGAAAVLLVKNQQDFLLAGRSLPLYLEVATLFATWFGAETVLGASATMAHEGIYGVIEDPFGASLCLVLVGRFVARPLYRMKILTFGDFYRERYNKPTELIASVFLILSYIGWIAAQMVALGIIFHIVSPSIPVTTGTLIGASVVIIYTFLGGMWSISITDLMQTILIIAGMVFVFWKLNTEIPVGEVINRTPKEFFDFFRPGNPAALLNYAAAWITIGLGSIPQQDVFQRVMSSRTEGIAVRASYWGAGMYLTIAIVPLILALYARIMMPGLLNGDAQMMLPALVIQKTPVAVQVLFFGAMLSAIMSTASEAILAPAAILSENIFSHFIFKGKSDKALLMFSRISVLIIAAVSMTLAFSSSDIYELVGQSSILSLVSLFVPMAAGIYWKKANSTGATLALILGMAGWIIAARFETAVNPLLYGLGASAAGMLAGVYLIRPEQNSILRRL